MLSLEDPPHSEIMQISDCVQKYGSKCEIITTDELTTRFPGLNFHPETLAAFEPESGMLLADRCLRALQVCKIDSLF